MLLKTEKNKAALVSAATLQKARLGGETLEAPAVLCDAAHNLLVDLGCMTGVIPRGEAAGGTGGIREIAVLSRVGRPVCFQILDFFTEGGEKKALLSRRAAQEEALSHFMAHLFPGCVLRAKVTHLEPFGAFVDIGRGIVSLIGIENISVSRITHPAERFSPGQELWAVVTGVDREQRRIFLSHKELLGTWEQNAADFKPGETVPGIIRDMPEYGAFVELRPNLSGLAEHRRGFKTGDHVSVFIKSILPDRMKIKLILIDRLEEKNRTAPLRYYLPEEEPMSLWTYTPEGCRTKRIETRFL